MEYRSIPASDYPITELVDVLNRGFEGYFVPISFNSNTFLNMLRKDGTDLTSSRVLLAEEQPAGIALLARRGWTSRLAAMGIAKEYRGAGAGSWFMNSLVEETRQRGERAMVLEVIEQNESAVRLYQKYGFEVIRRLIGLIRKDAMEMEAGKLEEIDIRKAAALLSDFGLPDLPWQLSGESIATMSPPARAYCKGSAYIVISNPDAKDVVIWSVLVEPSARGHGLGTDLVRSVIGQHPDKTWHVPAILPEELGKIFERAGFVREQVSQWQMRLGL